MTGLGCQARRAFHAHAPSCTLWQVEFYFSDSNLPRDAFMLEKVRSSPEGFVPLALLATFQRMSKLLNSSHRDVATVPAELVEALAATLEASASLTLSEDRASVRRTEVCGRCFGERILVSGLGAVLAHSSFLCGRQRRFCDGRPMCLHSRPHTPVLPFTISAQALPEFEELSKQVEERSLYVSPFPFDTTLDQLTGRQTG